MTQEEKLKKHSAGAIIKPESPFTKLEIPVEEHELTQIFIDDYVAPVYMDVMNLSNETIKPVLDLSEKINIDIVYKLLAEENWRPRIVGALYAGLFDFKEYSALLGNLLLRSDLCFCGKKYSLTLFHLDKQLARDIYYQYLSFYLQRPDYEFDQYYVYAAYQVLAEEEGFEIEQDIKDLFYNFGGQMSLDNVGAIEQFRDDNRTFIKIKKLVSF